MCYFWARKSLRLRLVADVADGLLVDILRYLRHSIIEGEVVQPSREQDILRTNSIRYPEARRRLHRMVREYIERARRRAATQRTDRAPVKGVPGLTVAALAAILASCKSAPCYNVRLEPDYKACVTAAKLEGETPP